MKSYLRWKLQIQLQVIVINLSEQFHTKRSSSNSSSKVYEVNLQNTSFEKKNRDA